MWLKIYALALCALCSAQEPSVHIEPFQSVFSVMEGSSLQVNCTSSNSVKWSADPPKAMPSKADTVIGRASPDDSMLELMLTNISKSNRGRFYCTDPVTNDEVSFQLRVFSMVTQGATFEYKVDTMLECSVNETGMTVTYSWSKGGTPVSEISVEGKQGFVTHDNGSLEIIHPARRFAGMYTCTAQYKRTDDVQSHNITVDIPYLATPKVLPFDKSKNLVEDEKLVVVCEVLGYPKPTITWMKANQVLENGKDSRYKLSAAEAYDGMTIDNAQLEIETVGYEDAGEYLCIARQLKMWPGFNSSQPILVRVKDKLAALWPFLGIVAEVVILCAIIFIYEKKRNKDALMDDDDDQDGTAAEKKSDNVRHRGSTNNPRA